MRRQLLDVMSKQLQRLESRVSGQAQMTSADYEREARALTALVRNFEALTGDDAALAKRGAQGGSGDGEVLLPEAGDLTPDDQDTFRRDIAARLVRLRERLGDQRG